ncbi:zinc finger protein 185 isoform X2 [Electrophorus electricus]|uniref:zinc finger protein 185 isoform X2 n=1 Tax=Electrophorus electricus TaxID=8005 RepID=UPI0015CFCF5F|nr:zinc finger protein 185 isoform X2 [Electrophorus electricus]
MSSERDRQSVLRTTKVRTALKGDSSWIQRSKGFEPEEDEKPCAKTPSSGYLIRGVFTKTETKSTQPSSANGHIGTSGFVKKASDGYKKIAPHTVRSNIETTERSEPSLSTEEQDKRTEAASSCLRNSAARQRSYVLSAAKKYESSEKPDGSAPTVTSFVAKRVVINEDEDSNPVEPNAETPVSPSSSGLVAQQSYSVEISVDEPAPPITAVGKKVPSPAPELKPEATPTKSDHILYATYDTSEPTSVWKPDAQFTPAPEAKNVSFTTPETKTEPTLKTSVTEGNAQVIKAPVLKKASSATPEPKPESAPKPSVTEPVTPIAPVAQKDTTKTPKPESTPKQSFTESINPTAPLAQKDSSKTLEPKPQPTPKPSVTEPVAPSTPVAQKGISKIPEPKPQPTPKPSVTEPIIPTVPVAQKDISKTLETKPESTPKPSVTEPTIPAAPVAQKDISKTPEPKPQPTPKPSVTEPVAPSTHVAQKDISKRPEPKPQPTPKPSLTEAVTPTVPVAQKDIFKTLETKPESTPKPSVTELITPATLVAQKGPYKTSEPKQEITPKKSVKTLQKTSDLNDIDLLDLTQSTLQKQVDLNPTTTDLLTGIGSSLPQSEKTRGSLDLLALDVIPIDTNSDKLSTDKLNTKDETTKTVVWSKDPRSVTELITPATLVAQKGPYKTSEPKQEITPKKSVKTLQKTSDLNDIDLLDLTQSTLQKQVDLNPTTTDLLTGIGSSLPQSEKTRGSLDLLALDVIPIDTNSDKLSTDKLHTKDETTKTVVWSKDPRSSTEMVTITTNKTEIVKGSALRSEYSAVPQSEKTWKSLDLLAKDVIPFDTDMDDYNKTQSKIETSKTVMYTKKDSESSLPQSEKTQESLDLLTFDVIPSKENTANNKMQSKVETSQTIMYTKNDSKSSLPQSEKTQESLDLLAFDVIPNKENIDKPKSDKTQSEVETSQTVMLPKDSKGTMERFDPIMLDSQKSKKQTLTYETKESDSGSPWDEWTSSTVYTTIKKSDMKADPQPMADSYTYSRVQDSPAQESRSLDADTKRSFVYVKEYVNLSELSTQNDVRDGDYLSSTTSRYAYSSPSSDGDYLTSTISRYAYSSPSSVNATACTYCGRLVGNDAKITIEHLNISCHPDCFKCGICSKPMGDFLDNMFLHRGTVHCESCYANVH